MIAVARRAERNCRRPQGHAPTLSGLEPWLAIGLLLCGFAAPAMCAAAADIAQVSTCNARIIVGLAQAMQPPPSDQWVRSLATANRVELHFLRAITARLFLFRVSVPDAAASCSAPIARLRRDSRLRSVELDQRRKHDAG
jgi:hypothetical protein